MKNTLTLLTAAFVMLCTANACKKSGTSPALTYYPINSQLKASFDYKPGTYWVYRDSVSGEVDSAYVASNITEFDYNYTCNGQKYDSSHEAINIIINFVVTTPTSGDLATSVNESWTLYERDNIIKMTIANNADSLQTRQNVISLATFPFATGVVPSLYGCAISPIADSANVTQVFNSYGVAGKSYINTALSTHALLAPQYAGNIVCNAQYYISVDAGIVKARFDHPSEHIFRVLELQRFNVVR